MELQESNRILLAKLGWRCLKETKTLSSAVLREKHGGLLELHAASKTKKVSPTWRGIYATRDILMKGIQWKVRNGKTIRFWLDNWLMDDAVINLVLCNVETEHQSATVRDYWNGDERK